MTAFVCKKRVSIPDSF